MRVYFPEQKTEIILVIFIEPARFGTGACPAFDAGRGQKYMH